LNSSLVFVDGFLPRSTMASRLLCFLCAAGVFTSAHGDTKMCTSQHGTCASEGGPSFVQKRSVAKRAQATEGERLAATKSSWLSSLLGASHVLSLQASIAKDGLSSYVSFSYAGKEYQYDASAFSVFAKNAEVRHHTDQGVETRERGPSRNFKSRAEGSWVSASLQQHGEVTSVSGLFQVQGGVVQIRPLNETDSDKFALLAMAEGKTNAHTLQHVNISGFYTEPSEADSLDPSVADSEDGGIHIPHMMEGQSEEPLLNDGDWNGVKWWPGCYSGDDQLHEFRVGVVVDVAAFQLHGAQAMSNIADIFTEASFVYEHQMNIRLVIGHASVYESTKGAPSYAASCQAMSTQLVEMSKDNDLPFEGSTHLFTGCQEPGPAGLGYIGTICNTGGYNKGVNRFDHGSRRWVLFAHELGHNFAGGHSFEEGQGKTGGIMDYGDGTLDGEYQFNTKYRKAVMCKKIESVGNCQGKFVPTTVPTMEPTLTPTAVPTPAPTPAPIAPFKTMTVTWGSGKEKECAWQCSCSMKQNGCQSQDKCDRYEWEEQSKVCKLFQAPPFKTVKVTWGNGEEKQCAWQCTCSMKQNGCNSQDKCDRYEWEEQSKICNLFQA